MSHNRKMTPDEAKTVREFALFILCVPKTLSQLMT
jgi:hypothetical protein